MDITSILSDNTIILQDYGIVRYNGDDKKLNIKYDQNSLESFFDAYDEAVSMQAVDLFIEKGRETLMCYKENKSELEVI